MAPSPPDQVRRATSKSDIKSATGSCAADHCGPPAVAALRQRRKRRGGPMPEQSREPADGDPAHDELDGLGDAYARLRRIAGRLMRGERDGHTLSPTDVMHEAIARLLASGEL